MGDFLKRFRKSPMEFLSYFCVSAATGDFLNGFRKSP